ncbi:hypothetical protein [Nonomuraea indica]|uniref:Uncharacterized protein n=1 Tax=Nonomuraea indica TaxID=1581193 RepID=A0ABW7ZYW3_9ACTN
MTAPALNKVIPLLGRSGINAQLIKRVPGEVNAAASGPIASSRLMVHADGGWRVATISVAARSGAYRVEPARTGRDSEELPDRVEMAPVHRPARVALLVAANEGRA